MESLTSIPNPDDWLDVVTILIVSLIVAVPSWLAARNHRTIKKVESQVVNGHTTPMRQDMDEIRDTLNHIRAELRVVKAELSDIRHELRDERKDRLDLDHRFEDYKRQN